MKRTILLALLLTCGAAQAASWLCVGDQSTGFKFGSKQWHTATFPASDEKLIIRTPTAKDKQRFPGMTAKVIAVDLGNHRIPMACGYIDEPKSLACQGITDKLLFSTVSLRFQYYYEPGYVEDYPDSPEGQELQSGNTPHLTIGRCTAIE